MATLVLTVLGDDRSGLVDSLAGVVAAHGGNWERSQMTRLAGKFAGIVLVTVPDDRASELVASLAPLGEDGLLEVSAVEVDAPTTPETSTPTDTPPVLEEVVAGEGSTTAVRLGVEGADRPGIMRDVAHVLAARGLSIETLDTTTAHAPMAGGLVFRASAHFEVPDDVDLHALRVEIEAAVLGLLVDLSPLPPDA